MQRRILCFGDSNTWGVIPRWEASPLPSERYDKHTRWPCVMADCLIPIRELSGGQKAKVLLLRMSLSGANVLILDEPTRNFSPLSGPVIRKMLREFPGAVISISHDRKYIEEVCDKIYQLNPNGLQLIGD